METQTTNCGMLLTSPTRTSENQCRMFGEDHWLLLCGEHHWHKNNAKCGMLRLLFKSSCFNYKAKDIGQRSVHIFQDGETHSLQKSPKVLLLHLITMHKHGSWYLLLIYIRLMIGLQIVLLCITWLIDEIFSTIFKRFLKDLGLLKQHRWMVRLMTKETYTSLCHIMDNKIMLFFICSLHQRTQGNCVSILQAIV